MSDHPVSSEGEFTSFRTRNMQFRSESRYKSPLAAIAYIYPENAPERRDTVWLANVSYHGLGFLSKNPVEPKARLVVEIQALNTNRQLLVDVMHSTQQLNGDWLVGCQFDAPLSHDDLEECLSFDAPFAGFERK